MADKPNRSKRGERSAERPRRVVAGKKKGGMGKGRCVACNAVLVHDLRVPLETSERKEIERHCPECRKIARLRLQFPLLQQRNDDPGAKAGPILPLSLIASLCEYWEHIGSPLAGCTEFLSPSDDANLRGEIGRQLFRIFHLADNGDKRAQRLLHDVADRAVEGLEDIACRQPHLLRPFARKGSRWPSFIGKKTTTFAELHRTRLKELQIGAENPFAGNWQPNSPATMTAIYMHRWLELHRQALGLPSPETPGAALKWFDVGWRALLVRTDGHPEKNVFLKQLGRRGLKLTAKRYKGDRLPTQSEAVNRRAEIKKRVKQAYFGFVRDVFSA
jgi:hypothetical protein